MSLSTFQRSLATLPARQLNLLAVGAVAIAAAMAFTAIRAPLANLRAQRARLAAASAAAAASAPTKPAQLKPAQLKPTQLKPIAAPSPLALIAAVSAGAHEAGVTVASAVPGVESAVAGLRRQTLDVEASGSYDAILDWIAAIEARQPAVGVVHMELRPAPDEPRRQVRLQLAAYSTGDAP